MTKKVMEMDIEKAKRRDDDVACRIVKSATESIAIILSTYLPNLCLWHYTGEYVM